MREPIPDELRRRVFRRDGKKCRYCGKTDGAFHIDHVYPVVKGGETTLENLVVACKGCNLSKHSKVGIWPKPIGYFDEIDKVNAILNKARDSMSRKERMANDALNLADRMEKSIDNSINAVVEEAHDILFESSLNIFSILIIVASFLLFAGMLVGYLGDKDNGSIMVVIGSGITFSSFIYQAVIRRSEHKIEELSVNREDSNES